MNSAVVTTDSNVDTSSIYDSLNQGGIALRAVSSLPSPEEIFKEKDRSDSNKYHRVVPEYKVEPEVEIYERKGNGLVRHQVWTPSKPKDQPSYANSRGFGIKVRSWDDENKVGAISFEHIENPTEEQKSVKDLKKKYDEDQAPLVDSASIEHVHQSNDVLGNSRKGLLKNYFGPFSSNYQKTNSTENSVSTNSDNVRSSQQHPLDEDNGGVIDDKEDAVMARKMLADARKQFFSNGQHSSASKKNGIKNDSNGGDVENDNSFLTIQGESVETDDNEPEIEMEPIDGKLVNQNGSTVKKSQPHKKRFQFFVQSSPIVGRGRPLTKVSEEQPTEHSSSDSMVHYVEKQAPGK